MRHREAISHLPKLASGSAEPELEAAVTSHVRRCSACQGWLAAHDLLVRGLSPAEAPGDDHPDSHLLALCAVRPGEIHEPDREELRNHLALCPACRGVLRLTVDAVREGKPDQLAVGRASPPRAPQPLRWQRLLPAALVVLSVAGGLLAGGRFLQRPTSGKSNPEPPLVVSTLHQIQEGKLSGYELEGIRVISADQPLTVANLTVKSGADVTFLARDGIAFGNGFRVAEGARIRVASGSSASAEAMAMEEPRSKESLR